MLFKQLFAIAASLTLVTSLHQPSVQAQSTTAPVTAPADNSDQLPGLPGLIWLIGGTVLLIIFLPKIG